MNSALFKISAILWVIWGFVHVMAGVAIIPGDTVSGFQSIAAAVEPALLDQAYHSSVGAVLNQHAWNLAWVGAVTISASILPSKAIEADMISFWFRLRFLSFNSR